jgi:hypothetical protein
MTTRGEASLDAHVPLLVVKFTTQKWNHPCELLIRARMVPDRAGADTQVLVLTGLGELRQRPGGSQIERAWLGAGPGGPGFLTGKDAEAAACDAMIVPVVTGHADMSVIDKIIDIALAALDAGWHRHPDAGPHDHDPASHDPADSGPVGHGPDRATVTAMTPDARDALRYAIARLAIDFVSGPGGLASCLRTGLLDRPYSTPSLPLDIGFSQTIPGQHPPRGPAARQGLRLAALRPSRRLL